MKNNIERIFKICSNCPCKFFRLDGSGYFARPKAQWNFERRGDKFFRLKNKRFYPASYFVFSETTYDNPEICINEEGTRCKHKSICNHSYIDFSEDKLISFHRDRLFYKVLAEQIKKGHLTFDIYSDCPYFMEMILLKDNFRQDMKNIFLIEH